MVNAVLALSFVGFFQAINTLQGVIFILGLIFLIFEMFTPGFGVAGGLGVVLLAAGIIMTARNLQEALLMFAVLLLLLAVMGFVIYRSAKKGKLAKKLILWDAAKREDGFSSSDDSSSLIGQKGVAITVLRPAGTGEFDGKRFDVVTDGEFVEAGTPIQVMGTEGRRIVVKKL